MNSAQFRKEIEIKKHVYLLLNKPKGYISSTETKDQKTVLDLVPQKGSIPLSTTHIMSNIVIELVPGAGFTQEEFMAATKSVAIGNVKNNALINLSTGGVTAVGEPTSIKTYKDGDTYKAIIVPQSVAADADMLIITVADVVYTSKETFTFKSMTKHQFTVFVDKTAAGLDITVEDWIIDEENHTATVS